MPRKPSSPIAARLIGVGALALAYFPATAASAAEVASEEIRDGVWLFQGAGSNVVALADGEALLVIDGGLDENSADLLDAIEQATGTRTIATLIDTHWHPEQVGLNDEAGADGAVIVAHESTLRYLSHPVTSPLFEGSFGPLEEAARPNETTRAGGELSFAGHRVVYGYLPAAHTDGDLYVYFPELDILAAGGAVGSDSWPLIDYWNGGFIGGLVRGHEALADLVGDDTVVIPAQGPVLTGAELVRHRDMYRQLFRDLNFLMNKGMGYDDVVDINPLQGREAEFGDPSRFLDGAYRSTLMAYVPD
jgi:glyoxylase-like metal-dependent hydrolase (beta-lactamase superfamily II)